MRVLVTGVTGFLGSAVFAELISRGHELTGLSRHPTRDDDLGLDLCEPGAPGRAIGRTLPEGVVHLAAVPDIAPCREDPARARRLNTEVPGELAAACARAEARLVAVSTDQVFDGSRGGWSEEDEALPLHVYGQTKLAGERAVLAACPAAVVLRPGLVTGRAPAGRRSSTTTLLETLERGATPSMFTDESRSPVAVQDVARAIADLLERADVSGLLHCGGPEPLSRYRLARREAERAGLDPDRVGAGTRVAAGLDAERPADLSLNSARLIHLLGWTPRTLAD